MTDVSPADWVLERLRPWPPGRMQLENFAPEGFDGYARVFHPAGFRPAHRGAVDPGVGIRWADLARANDIALTADISFYDIAGVEQRTLDEIEPQSGELPPETCDALAALLRPHTRTPERCWYCLWDGNGAFWSESHGPLLSPGATRKEAQRYAAEARAQDEILGSTPRVEAESRSYFLFRGPLDAACGFEPAGWVTSPNLWWPADRSWIVVTEVDGFSTYVGGSRAVVHDLLASHEVEAIEVTLQARMDSDM